MAVFQEQDRGGQRFVIRPNCALSWQTTKLLIWFFAACLVAVAAYFVSLGAWLVLPFAGLELLVLAFGFYASALAGHRREVIEIKGPVLRVLRGGRRLDEIASFPANWTQVVLRPDPRGWYPSRLLLRYEGSGLEVGGKLVEAEREELAASLREMLDVRLMSSEYPAGKRISEESALPAQMGHGVDAANDADQHQVTTGTFLASDGARAAGCARGAFTEKREELWQ